MLRFKNLEKKPVEATPGRVTQPLDANGSWKKEDDHRTMSTTAGDPEEAGANRGPSTPPSETNARDKFKALHEVGPSNGEARGTSNGRKRCCSCFPLSGRIIDILLRPVNFRKVWQDTVAGPPTRQAHIDK